MTIQNTFSSDALSGRKALIFAASQGLGKASAETLAGMGASVVLVARSANSLTEVADGIKEQSGKPAQIEVADLTDEKALLSLLDRHIDADILVTNCGGPPVAPFEELTISDWDEAYQMIIRSVVLACQKLVPAMAGRGWGRVVMLTSSVVVDPMRNFSLSNALRKSLLGLAESLAEEYAVHGVTANLVCPGLTQTGRMESLIRSVSARTGKSEDIVLQGMLAPIAVKRMAQPQEISAAVAFLCTEAAGFIQGQALLVDGGQSVNP
jgi:3-oxoacyl-[acyl-carrier protein] reductase